jgi:hypothetical protein
VYLTAVAVLSPWLWYCIQHSDFSILVGPMFDINMLKASAVVPLEGAGAGSVFGFVVEQAKGMILFYRVYVLDLFILWPVFIAASAYALVHLVFRENRVPLLYLFFCGFLFSPVIFLGIKSEGVNFRHGQFMIFYFLLYLVLAFAVADLPARAAAVFSGKAGVKKAGTLFSALIIIVCLFFQMAVPPASGNNHALFSLFQQDKMENIYGFALWRHDFNDRDGWAADTPREAARWIQENIPAGQTILCQWFYLNMLDYLTENRYDFKFVPYTFYHETPGKKALFIWPRYNVKILEGNSLVALYEQDLLAQVNEGRVKYVLATFRRNFLSLYLNAHPDFEMVHSITHGRHNIKVYAVRTFPVHPIDKFVVKLDEDIYPFFFRAFTENRPVYRFLTSQIQTILNWDERQVDDFDRLIGESDEAEFWRSFEKVKPRTVY